MFVASKKIFIESSIFLAFIDRVHPDHLKVVQLLEYLGKEGFEVYTSSLVVLNVFNRVDKDMGFTVAMEFMQAMLESNIEILVPGKGEFVSAFKFLKLSKKTLWPLAEIVNADLMVKNRLMYVLTIDKWGEVMGTKVSELVRG
jgi:predicted nucleic acid-binding protein